VRRGSFEGALAKVEKQPLHPLVRARLQVALAEAERDRGDAKAAQKRLDDLGIIRKWRIAGPYDNEGRKGFDAVYPPEKGDASVKWRDVETVRGVLSFDGYLRPDTNRVGYAETTIDSSGDVGIGVGPVGAGA